MTNDPLNQDQKFNWSQLGSAIPGGIGMGLSAYFAMQGQQAQAAAMTGTSRRDVKVKREQRVFDAVKGQMGDLVSLLNSKKANRPVYTVPNVAPRSWLDEINWKIHTMLHGG